MFGRVFTDPCDAGFFRQLDRVVGTLAVENHPAPVRAQTLQQRRGEDALPPVGLSDDAQVGRVFDARAALIAARVNTEAPAQRWVKLKCQKLLRQQKSLKQLTVLVLNLQCKG